MYIITSDEKVIIVILLLLNFLLFLGTSTWDTLKKKMFPMATILFWW